MLIDVLTPVFAIILCGYVLGRKKILGPEASAGMNGFVYFVSFPALLFVVVAKTPPAEIFYWPFFGAWIGGLAVVYLLTAVISLVFYRDGLAKLGMRGLNTTCASTAFIGIPLCTAAFGKDAAFPAVLATTLLAIFDLSASILLIETERNAQGKTLAIVANIAKALAKNPLMIGSALGIAFSVSGLHLPAAVSRLCEIVGGAAIPCSLVTLGLFFAGHSLLTGLSEVNVLTVLKLVVHPLVTWLLIFYVFPLDGRWTAIAVLLAALPPATTVFVIAQRYGIHVQQTASTMLISTIASIGSAAAVLLWLAPTR
ncbi:AEC family transporter [Variovorax paradoxus]|nr:AEC family transporter [Variovorax paradoxus]